MPGNPISLPLGGLDVPHIVAESALFVGSFPPRQCGIATFTKDIADSYDNHVGSRSHVIAIDDPSACEYAYSSRVIGRIREGELRSYYEAALLANRHPCDIVNIQHEYGLFGGENGEWCLDFMDALTKPTVLTLHTVLPSPKPRHASVTQRLCNSAALVVVLSETARRILTADYGVAAGKVTVVHHGVPDLEYQTTSSAKNLLGLSDRTVVSTFGLISGAKGLEYAVPAIHEIAQSHPDVLYLILGATHPHVRRAEGERYRSLLHERIVALGLKNNIAIIDRYLPLHELVTYLQATDVYVTPYLEPDQVVSGTLAYALGAGKAIVSTPYLYARELLSEGRGLLASFRDSRSLAQAIGQFLNDPAFRADTEARAYRFGRQMIWESVATKYADLFATTSLKHRAHPLKRHAIASFTTGSSGLLSERASLPKPQSAGARLHALRAGSLR